MTGLKAKLLETAKALQSALLDLLYPKDVCCLCCDRAIAPDAQDGLCDDCLAALDALGAQPQAIDPAPGIVRAAAAFPYTGQARRLIIRLKYERLREAAVPLARAMAMLPGGETDVLVPVPTTKKRLRKRGYNQAQVLAALVAGVFGLMLGVILLLYHLCSLESCGVAYMTPFASGGRGILQALTRPPAAKKSRREPALKTGRR